MILIISFSLYLTLTVWPAVLKYASWVPIANPKPLEFKYLKAIYLSVWTTFFVVFASFITILPSSSSIGVPPIASISSSVFSCPIALSIPLAS